MSRGFPSQKALDASLPIAQARGVVIFFRQDHGTPGDFQINGPGDNVVVRVKRTRRIHCTIPEITIQNSELIALLRTAILSPGTSREFWLWSPYGTMRFFRVENACLVEQDRHGDSLIQIPDGSAARKKSTGQDEIVKMIGNPSSEKYNPPGKSLCAITVPHPMGIAKPDLDPGRKGENDPPAIRYLRKRKARDEPLTGSPGQSATEGSPGEAFPSTGEGIAPK